MCVWGGGDAFVCVYLSVCAFGRAGVHVWVSE